jgi:hypothetical protein
MKKENIETHQLKNDVIFQRKNASYKVKIIAVTKQWVVVERLESSGEEMTWKIDRFIEEFELE